MANRSYLVCCDFPDTCPGSRWPEIDARRHVLGEAAHCVPLLWLALFCRDDLRVSSVADQCGRQFTDISPIAEVATARRQLIASATTLNHLFRRHGSFERYVDALLRLFEQPPGRFVSLELLEISYMGDVGEFARQLKRALSVLSEPDATAGLDGAPLWTPPVPPSVPQGLRGKAAVSFVMEATGRDRKSVERTLNNCSGNVKLTLEFFQWQVTDTTFGKSEESEEEPDDEPAWETLAALAGLNLRRPFPSIADALSGRLSASDDQHNFTCLIGDCDRLTVN